MNFMICFQHLVLLEMASFVLILKSAKEKFAVRCKRPNWYKAFVQLLLE